MNALQEIAHALNCLRLFHCLGSLIEFTQVRPGAKAALQLAVEDQRVRILLKIIESRRELFQLKQRQRTQFVAGGAVQREFNDSTLHLPRQRLPGKLLPAQGSLSLNRYTACLTWYISSISFFMRAEIRSRFSLPLA